MSFSSLKDWLDSLKSRSADRVCVLVEGKRDFSKLTALGVRNICTLKGRRYYDVIEEILENCNLCIILFDLDKHGERMTKKFSALLKKEGIKVDLSYREYLKTLGVIEVENIFCIEKIYSHFLEMSIC
ncbi:MAG: toprim domain-containing protein [Hydrogenothermaceae bacterium]|nr:toprim domain-containing protein [Hydrogenothermaceae bacterium]